MSYDGEEAGDESDSELLEAKNLEAALEAECKLEEKVEEGEGEKKASASPPPVDSASLSLSQSPSPSSSSSPPPASLQTKSAQSKKKQEYKNPFLSTLEEEEGLQEKTKKKLATFVPFSHPHADMSTCFSQRVTSKYSEIDSTESSQE